MDYSFQDALSPIMYGGAFLIEVLVLVVVGKYAKQFASGYELDEQLTEEELALFDLYET